MLLSKIDPGQCSVLYCGKWSQISDILWLFHLILSCLNYCNTKPGTFSLHDSGAMVLKVENWVSNLKKQYFFIFGIVNPLEPFVLMFLNEYVIFHNYLIYLKVGYLVHNFVVRVFPYFPVKSI